MRDWISRSLPFPHVVMTPARLCVLLALACLALSGYSLATQLPAAQWAQALFVPDERNIEQVLTHYSWLPRWTISLLAGGALGIAGVLMQQVLRNPLAAPTTLGVATGAQLALLLATLFAPGLLVLGREWVAVAGGGLAMGLVFALAWRRGLAPMVVVLAGLVVNLYLGAVSTTLILFHQEELRGLMVWGAGSLSQNSWDGVLYLLPRLLITLALAALMLRPLAILELDDVNARSLGVSLRHLRLLSLGLAVFITACVVSVVGIIGFIGLAAPAIVRLLGARTLPQRLLWAPLLGALLLTTTDQLLQHVSGALPTMIPTGATTAALGAPLLLWLIPRLKLGGDRPQTAPMLAAPRRRHPMRLQLALGLALLVALAASLLLGQDGQGWALPSWSVWQATHEWRLPRTLAAAGAGTLLALAGTLIQRVTGNPMASPEVVGISGGTAIGLIGVVMFVPDVGLPMLLIAGTLSALATLGVLLLINRRSGFQPERVLLTGIAITALFDPLRSIVLANGDPRTQQLLAWMSGSTYYVDTVLAVAVAASAVILTLAMQSLSRWLDLLPMGNSSARALGVNVDRARLALLGVVALLTAAATLVVGPLSFVGLLAPHMARLLGAARARAHLLAAALLGALLMVLADWLGRQWLFPQEIPAGLMSSLLGGAYFMWTLRRL